MQKKKTHTKDIKEGLNKRIYYPVYGWDDTIL